MSHFQNVRSWSRVRPQADEKNAAYKYVSILRKLATMPWDIRRRFEIGSKSYYNISSTIITFFNMLHV